MNLRAWFRQRQVPAEFRIRPPAQGAANAAVVVGGTPPPSDQEPEAGAAPGELADETVADLVTEIWRARRKVDGPDAEQDAPRAVRWASRYLSAAADRLSAAGIEADGHDGLRFDVGMELRVLAYQDAADVTEETVIETVRPSVRREGRVIQEGEVIVAVPANVERTHAPETRQAGAGRAVTEQRGHDDA
ncbi:hypothetical protein [Promicromonospora sp. NPDC057488]|uniref:hypothetical protein n=1 Tax=Promicromonospora sp. NPDC057488 TaxID=3346147 RepID=UPI00366D955A